MERVNLRGNDGEPAAQGGDILCVDGLPRFDLIKPLRNFGKRAQLTQRARIAPQGSVQFAKETTRFGRPGKIVSVVVDVLPEGESKAIVMMRSGGHFPARWNY